MTQEEAPELFEAEQILESNQETTVCFGHGAAFSYLSSLAMEWDGKNILLCGGGFRSFHESGVFAAIMNALSQVDVNLPRFENIPPEPDDETVRKIVEMIRVEKPDIVIAAGGGSVMDAAKAAWLSYQTGLDVSELYGVQKASTAFPGKEFKRVICIPTTAGTGSEMTPYANIVDSKSGVKCLISETAITPEYAFVDSEVSCSMQSEQTLSTGLDALVHCIESLLNFQAGKDHPMCAAHAVHAISLIVKNLPLALREPTNISYREQLSAAASIGGLCIRECPTSLPHLCSFSFCGKTSHGMAVAVLLPAFWKYYLEKPEVRERTMKIAWIFGNPESPEGVIAKYCEFLNSLHIPAALAELTGEGPAFIDRLIEDAGRNPMKLASAPNAVPPEKLAEIFHRILDPVWG